MTTLKHFWQRVAVVTVAALALVGCSSGPYLGSTTEAIESTTITRTLQTAGDRTIGEPYQFTMTVPESWVGVYETQVQGNRMSFYRAGVSGGPILSIDALTRAQYWRQIGSYPGDFTNIQNTGDTYFVYSVPYSPYFTSSSGEAFDALIAEAREAALSLVVDGRGNATSPMGTSNSGSM